MIYLGLFLIAIGSFLVGFYYCQYSIIARLRSREKYINYDLPPLYVLEIIFLYLGFIVITWAYNLRTS